MKEFRDLYRHFCKCALNDGWNTKDSQELKNRVNSLKPFVDHEKTGLVLINTWNMYIDLTSQYPDRFHELIKLVMRGIMELEQLLETSEKPKIINKEIKDISNAKYRVIDEEPIKTYGTIKIQPSIVAHIWKNLPDDRDFRHDDIKKLFKDFYENMLNRKISDRSYDTYASGYLRYFKEMKMISYDKFDYSKDPNKYKSIRTTEKKRSRNWTRDEMTILKKRYKDYTVKEIHEKFLHHRTEGAIEKKASKLGLKKLHFKKKDEKIDTNKIRKETIENNKTSHEIIEEELIKKEPELPKPSNPYYEGSVEYYLYKIAIETNWMGKKNRTPMIMIDKRMSGFKEEEIETAIDKLVEDKRADRLPNNFIAFY